MLVKKFLQAGYSSRGAKKPMLDFLCWGPDKKLESFKYCFLNLELFVAKSTLTMNCTDMEKQ